MFDQLAEYVPRNGHQADEDPRTVPVFETAVNENAQGHRVANFRFRPLIALKSALDEDGEFDQGDYHEVEEPEEGQSAHILYETRPREARVSTAEKNSTAAKPKTLQTETSCPGAQTQTAPSFTREPSKPEVAKDESMAQTQTAPSFTREPSKPEVAKDESGAPPVPASAAGEPLHAASRRPSSKPRALNLAPAPAPRLSGEFSRAKAAVFKIMYSGSSSTPKSPTSPHGMASSYVE